MSRDPCTAVCMESRLSFETHQGKFQKTPSRLVYALNDKQTPLDSIYKTGLRGKVKELLLAST